MKTIYILVVVVVVALTLGCVGNKQDETSTKTQIPPGGTTPEVTSTAIASQAPAPANGEDLFGTESDMAALDSILNDSSLDTTLSTSI